MLAFTFFALIFSSLLWLIYALRFIHDSLAGISFFDAGAANILIYMLLICAPIFLVWAVFGYVNQYLNNKNVNLQLRKLMGQMKKNQDYSDLLARALIETEQHINDGFVLSKFDLLIADMNELLSEIIRGCKLASPEQIESLWSKVQNGGKWSFGKVIIEVHNAQPNFQKRTLERAVYDPMLGGTIMEFCARYQAVLKMLENHDRDKLFLEMIETGVMGKVFSIMAPIAAEIRRGREAVADFAPQPAPIKVELKAPRRAAEPEPENMPQESSLLNKINIFKRRKPDAEPLRREPERDPFSIALERSFGENAEENEPAAPFLSARFDEETAPIIEDVEEEMPAPQIVPEPTDTQKTLDNLKKEWAETRREPAREEKPETAAKPAAAEEFDDDNLTYPFGSWTDEQNYRK